MENLELQLDTILYFLFAGMIWLLGRVVTLIAKTTKAITRLVTVVERVEKDIDDHELRLRDVEK